MRLGLQILCRRRLIQAQKARLGQLERKYGERFQADPGWDAVAVQGEDT